MFVRFICRLEKKLRETTDFRPQTVSKTQQKHYKSEKKKKEKKVGPAEIWTRILRFRVSGANRYTTGPVRDICVKFCIIKVLC